MRAPLLVPAFAALALWPLTGCVAAALPLVAGASVLKSAQDRQDTRRKKSAREAKQPVPQPGQILTTAEGRQVEITGLTAMPLPDSVGPVAPPMAGPESAPPEMQFLYGSGEAAALSIQAYQALWNYLKNEIGYRRDKTQVRSAVLAPGSTIESPRFDTCGKRPLAVVLDIDETVLLNLGFEADAATRGVGYDQGRWTRWEQSGALKVAAVPGAAEVLAAARREGFTIIFNSNRSTATASQTIAALEHAGLGRAALGDTLWLRDEGDSSGKDARRARIAERYCIVALAGDQLGDFSDLFNAPGKSVRTRRNSASETMIAPLWGAGWFMLPNPVYGTGLKGGVDEIFPPESRWVDPEEKR
jgi:5'-nucleotidase (lipoprotein e(P4) family)